ncbi:DMT family transporter [Vibrio sp. CB1-14]|uniref:DMT family transporter n=1 Tax=Vibrio chaetopteri TaxID=3016528 RepID=A0AAU8BR17_9VIBR
MHILSIVNNEKHRWPVTEWLLLLVAIFWGTSYGMTKSALVFTSVLMFIAIRFSLTFIALLPVVIRDFKLGRNKDWITAIPTGAILSAIFFCEVIGVSKTTASNAAFLISLSVIFTAFAERLVNKHEVSMTYKSLVVLCIIGVYLLSQPDLTSFTFNSGDYWILGAACLRGLMVTTTKRLTEGRVISTVSLTALQSATVAVVAIIACGLFLPMDAISIPTSLSFWLMTLYLVAFCTLFAFFVQNYAVRRLSPTRVSLLMGSEPLFGALFAMLWLGEQLTALQALGALMIISSVIYVSLKKA